MPRALHELWQIRRSFSLRSIDSEFRELSRDSFYTAIWQGAISLADLLQIVMIARLLGLSSYGELAVVAAFVVLVDQFFDVRVTTATTAIAARRLEANPPAALGVFQASFLIDAATGLVGMIVVLALAPLLGRHLGGENGVELTVLYAFVLFGSTLDNTSVSILRLLRRFRLLAILGICRELIRVTLLAAALLFFDSLTSAVAGLILYSLTGAVLYLVFTTRAFRKDASVSLLRPAPQLVRDELKELLGMVFHTNILSYARLAQTQLPTILLGVFAGPVQAGIYKIGMALAAIVGRVSDPAYIAIMPRISRLLAAGRRDQVARLIRQASFVAIPGMAVVFAIVFVSRGWLVTVLGGSGKGATLVVALAGAAAAINGALFWNVPVLFASGLQSRLSKLIIVVTILQVLLLFILIPTLGAVGAALTSLIIQLLSNGVATFLVGGVLRGKITPEAGRTGPERLSAPESAV
jgi:O-antigen/teichoic acid export membrane protein